MWGFNPNDIYGVEGDKPKRPIANALAGGVKFAAQVLAPEEYAAAKTRKTRNALADAMGSGDYEAASQAAYKLGHYGTGLQLAQQQKEQERQGLQMELAFLQNAAQSADPARFIRDNPEFGQLFDDIDQLQFAQTVQQNPELLQDAILKAQAELGQAPQQAQADASYTLSPGARRYGANNEIVAENPTAAPQSEDIVRSQFIGDNGNVHLVYRSGRIEDSGQPVSDRHQLFDMGGGAQGAFNPRTSTVTPLTTAEQSATNQATAETITADEERRREAQFALPQDISDAQTAIASIEGLLSHEGFEDRYGMTSYVPVIRGTRGAGAQAFIDQIGGQAFLQAFQSLKGGGHITEIEGQKATQAITRLADQRISADEARRAGRELIEIMERGMERQRAEASGRYGAPESAPTLKFNPQTGEFE